MIYTFRPLAPADRAAVEAVCDQSFAWGDYIPAVFDDWLDDPTAHFYAAMDQVGSVVGIGRVRLLDGGATAWCEGDRVAPDRRRRGVGRALLLHAAEWGRARGARRLRALVNSENAASMALFAGAGFDAPARFDRWSSTPRPGGRLPRPLPVEELEQALAFARRAIPFAAAHGMYVADWTAHDLDAERLAAHMERQEALLAGDSMGALAIITDFTPAPDNEPAIAFLGGAPVAITRLLRGIRTLAHLRGLAEVQALLPREGGLDGMLAHSGFARTAPGQMVVWERALD